MAATKTKQGTATDLGAAAASAAPAPPERRLLTADLAAQARRERDRLHDFELTHTGPGIFARVRHVDLSDTATLTMLPERLLRVILGAVNDVETREGRPATMTADGKVDIDRAITAAKAETAATDAMCVAGFVEPRLVLTQEEKDRDRDADVVLIADIHPADRRRYVEWTQGRLAEASEKVVTFPDRSDAGLDAGRPRGVDGDAPVGAADARRDGAA